MNLCLFCVIVARYIVAAGVSDFTGCPASVHVNWLYIFYIPINNFYRELRMQIPIKTGCLHICSLYVRLHDFHIIRCYIKIIGPREYDTVFTYLSTFLDLKSWTKPHFGSQGIIKLRGSIGFSQKKNRQFLRIHPFQKILERFGVWYVWNKLLILKFSFTNSKSKNSWFIQIHTISLLELQQQQMTHSLILNHI